MFPKYWHEGTLNVVLELPNGVRLVANGRCSMRQVKSLLKLVSRLMRRECENAYDHAQATLYCKTGADTKT